MHLEILCKTLDELPLAASEIIKFAGKDTIWTFDGQMGAGKTTLIKKVCELLGVVDNVSSPTFSIVNEYLTEQGRNIYHFDFYRLKNEQEVLNIGVEEYFDSGNLCFLEWASKVASLMPTNYVEIAISVLPDSQRIIKLRRYE